MRGARLALALAAVAILAVWAARRLPSLVPEPATLAIAATCALLVAGRRLTRRASL